MDSFALRFLSGYAATVALRRLWTEAAGHILSTGRYVACVRSPSTPGVDAKANSFDARFRPIE
ncbi:MAG: hypothetical protein ND895_09110, partial [Pyrinomonadaceae bacterium]|nr:hypothetical protein [Pyrinomonadaceae bacterium]